MGYGAPPSPPPTVAALPVVPVEYKRKYSLALLIILIILCLPVALIYYFTREKVPVQTLGAAPVAVYVGPPQAAPPPAYGAPLVPPPTAPTPLPPTTPPATTLPPAPPPPVPPPPGSPLPSSPPPPPPGPAPGFGSRPNVAATARPVPPSGTSGLPPWPLTPLTTVETSDPSKVYAMASSSGLERERMLVIAPDAGGALAGTYALVGATMWRLTRSEGESYISPADPDRLGDLMVRHLEKTSGRAVVLVGLEKVVDACGLKVAMRLLEVARETAETNKGTVLVALNTGILKEGDVRQLEEFSTVVKVKG
ncbi:MAG: hypothetical protein KGJ23_06480 [Euryarchaeota archaeon]|nr:hypothetical protein [Euryarchaeota archaeon]MDE1836247.1 hypothetical protein [Euryarchaeota archaeon]MDE1881631.1 hypothetical protein [Euryarchaeota archaeon]MDE2044992.1 hypothetical protein [Thermoplasmata archaeon]